MTTNNVKAQLMPWNSYVTIPTQQYNYASLRRLLQIVPLSTYTGGQYARQLRYSTTLNLKIDTSTVIPRLYIFMSEAE
jgi:hypothetical protein